MTTLKWAAPLMRPYLTHSGYAGSQTAIPHLTAGARLWSLPPLLKTHLLRSSKGPAIPVIQRFGQIQGQPASESGEPSICR